MKNVSMEIISICRTASAAVKLCKACPALLFRIDAAAFKLIPDVRIRYAFLHISHVKLFIAHKLVAWIEIPPGRYCKILRSRTAARKPFRNAGASLQIYHKMEKIKLFSMFMPSYHL